MPMFDGVNKHKHSLQIASRAKYIWLELLQFHHLSCSQVFEQTISNSVLQRVHVTRSDGSEGSGPQKNTFIWALPKWEGRPLPKWFVAVLQ